MEDEELTLEKPYTQAHKDKETLVRRKIVSPDLSKLLYIVGKNGCTWYFRDEAHKQRKMKILMEKGMI